MNVRYLWIGAVASGVVSLSVPAVWASQTAKSPAKTSTSAATKAHANAKNTNTTTKAQTAKPSAALVAQAAKAYAAAVQNLAQAPYLQMSDIQKTVATFQLTKLGKKTSSVASQLGPTNDVERDHAKADATNATQPIIWYQSVDQSLGNSTNLQVGSRFFSLNGKTWVTNNANVYSVVNMLTLRDVPPFDSFVNPQITKVGSNYDIRGVVNVAKYFAKDKSETIAMNLVYPSLNGSALTTFLSHIREVDNVVLKKVGQSYVVSKDAASDKMIIPVDIFALMEGVSPATLSKYFTTRNVNDAGVVWYSYGKAPVSLPSQVQKDLGKKTVTGTVYG